MIYTFYSYKGGVGRSMAMANIAELFYRAGMKVLMVDWDLEAPGLEKFFDLNVEEVLDKPGVMDMILDYKEKMSQEIEAATEEDLPFIKPSDLALEVYPDAPGEGKLYLLTAGRRSRDHFSEYANSVLSFDWKEFYDKWDGELYFEWFRRRLNEMADIVLVDSRTGVTEMGGVCTYHFADVVVMFCATNKQNLDGTYEMARKLKDPEVLKRRNGRPIDLLIVPSRVEDRAEAQRLTRFRNDFVARFKDYAPENLRGGSEAMWRLKIPQVPYYAFNEMVATRQTGEVQSEDLENAFVNLTDVLATMSGKGEILGRLSREKENIRSQKLRDFTVQIMNAETGEMSGAGIVTSVDGKILTTCKVAMAALGVNPFIAKDKVLKVRFPQSEIGPNDRLATVLACSSESVDDDQVMLQLKDGPAPLRPDQVAVIGVADRSADRSANHSFRSYGFSVSKNYAPDLSKGIIESGVKPKGLHTLKLEPLKLTSIQGAMDMPGAAVLDTDLDVVVGLISHRPDDKGNGFAVLNTHILAFDPFNLPVYLNMGDAYARKSRYKDAIEAYKDAILDDPDQAMAWFGLGKTYVRIERIGEAIDSLNHALQLRPDLAPAWLLLGDAYLKSNEYEEAVYAFERSLKLEMKDQEKGHAWAGMGDAYRGQSRYDDAIEAYRKAVELAPRMASVWLDLGDILLRTGRYEESIDSFKKAIEIEPYKRAEINPKLELANRENLLVGKEEMARSLAEKERSLEEMERSLAEKERSIREKTRSLEEKNRTLKELTDTLVEKDRSLEEKTSSLQERDKTLAEKTRSIEEMDRSLNDKIRSLEEKDHSLREKNQWIKKKTLYNRILVASLVLLIMASIFSINAYNSINQNITNNPLYWKGEGQAILLGKIQDDNESAVYLAAIEAFDKSLEVASQPRAFWTPQSKSETWLLKGNSYVLLGNDLKSKKDDQASQRCYVEAIECYNKSIILSPLNYDSWIKKAQIESKLNRSEDSEFSSLQAIRINPNYGYQAWGLKKDGEKNPAELTQINSNKSFTNFNLLSSKFYSGDRFSPCELPPM